MVRELPHLRGAVVLGEISECHRDGHTALNGALRISLRRKPCNVSLHGVSAPAASNEISRLRTDEVLLEHEQSPYKKREITIPPPSVMCRWDLRTRRKSRR